MSGNCQDIAMISLPPPKPRVIRPSPPTFVGLSPEVAANDGGYPANVGMGNPLIDDVPGSERERKLPSIRCLHSRRP